MFLNHYCVFFLFLIKRKSLLCTNWGHSPDRIGIWKVLVFEERRKPGDCSEKKTSRSNKLNPHLTLVRESNLGDIDSRQVL